MRSYLGVLLFVALNACSGGEESVCRDLCDELYKACDYQAFPSYASCMQGCAYDIERGADIDSQVDCVLDAACNTFAIVECQNAHGPE